MAQANIARDLKRLARDIGEFKLDPKNAKHHTPRSVDGIAASLTEFGQTKPIVFDDDGIVIAGNGTLMAARKLGWDKLAAVRFQGDAKKRKKYALIDNRSAELAMWDGAELDAALAEIGLDDDLMAKFHFDEVARSESGKFLDDLIDKEQNENDATSTTKHEGEFVAFSLRLAKAEHQVLMAALAKAKKKIKTKTNVEALVHIAKKFNEGD